MCIQRHDQSRGFDILPSTGINVILPHHPTKKKVQTFARAAKPRRWEKAVENASFATSESELVNEALKRRHHSLIAVLQPSPKTFTQGTVAPHHTPRGKEKLNELACGSESVLESRKQ